MAALTTIATVGLGISAAGTLGSIGMNLSAAAKQSKAQSAAEQAAEDAAKKAESEYQREFAGGVQLPMEAYQQAGREGTAQQMQALQALQEADTRSLAAGVGKVQAAATEDQSGITDKMRQDLFSLESAQMEEKMANRDAIAKMNQERAIGAQIAAANAEAARAKAYAGIGQSIASLGGMALQAAPLYGKGKEDLSGVSQITPFGTTTSTTPTSSFDLSKLKTPGVSSFSSVENQMGYNYPAPTSGFNLSSLKIPTR